MSAAPATTHRRALRRILAVFAAVIVLAPLTLLGGAWTWLLVPLLLGAAAALRESLALRRAEQAPVLPRPVEASREP